MEFYTEIKTQGFYHTNNSKVFGALEWYYSKWIPFFRFRNVKYPIHAWPIGRMLLRATQRKLKAAYLNDVDTDMGGIDAFRGIDNGTEKWHNDLVEGCNTAFLLYMSDMTPETGGAIQFRTVGAQGVHTIYPKRYDIVIMDQSELFQHRVLPLNKPVNRDISHFEFNIREH